MFVMHVFVLKERRVAHLSVTYGKHCSSKRSYVFFFFHVIAATFFDLDVFERAS